MSKGSEAETRAEQAEKIVREPHKFKICEGCDSIVVIKAATCPNCHSYRFDDTPENVVIQAKKLGQREQRSVLASDLD